MADDVRVRPLPPAAARWTAFVSAVAAVGVSAYLTWAHFTEPAVLSCPDTGTISCTKVTTSAQSELFGAVPVALAGLVFFVVMAGLTSPYAWRRSSRRTDVIRLTGAVGGVAMCLYLVYAEVWEIRAICVWCTVVHVLTFVLFVAVVSAAVWRPLEPECPDLSLRRTRVRADI